MRFAYFHISPMSTIMGELWKWNESFTLHFRLAFAKLLHEEHAVHFCADTSVLVKKEFRKIANRA